MHLPFKRCASAAAAALLAHNIGMSLHVYCLLQIMRKAHNNVCARVLHSTVTVQLW
jgi:hypothetical protein